MVTRRCSERRYLMRPDMETNNAFVYCLAVAAQRTRVRVVFFVAMSNHYHAGVVDVAGRLPEFLAYFHKLFAKHQNVLRGRWENFWASEQTSVVELVDPDSVRDKMVYALTNPVKAHLVDRAVTWPGASSLKAQLDGAPLRVSRPRRFFRSDGPMPPDVTLELARPPGMADDDAQLRAWLAAQIKHVESTLGALRAKSRVRALGPKAVCRQPWAGRPRTLEPRRGLNPRIACKNTWRRIEALARNKAFLCAYKAARDNLLQGATAVFPAGTYWLQRYARQPCERPPPD